MLLMSASLLDAQARPVLTGIVRETTSGLPVSGAVVSLLDSSRAALQRTTSGAQGQYRLALSPAAVYVQVRRIGFRPIEQTLLRDNVEHRVLDLRTERLPSIVTGLIVRAQASCPLRNDTPVAFGLWEQARSALLASVVARESQAAEMRLYQFDRVMDHERARSMGVVTYTKVQSQASFSAALTPNAFVRSGFALDGPDDRTFFGPDAEVLLSDEFLNGYCMRLADRDPRHPERVGVRFVPARTQRGRQDIDGTLWIDTVARSLTHITYTYLMNDAQLNAARPGGEVVFAEMPNGAVLVNRWIMRLAGFKVESIPAVIRGNNFREGVSGTKRLVRVISENGGALAEARWRDGSSWRGSFGALVIRAATDSGRAVPGRVIRLARSPYRARTDSAGVVQFGELVAGPYEAVLEDERLLPIRLDLPVPVPREVVLGETMSIAMPFPTPESFVISRCRDDRRWKPGDVPTLLVRVMTSQGQAVENARIQIATTLEGLDFPLPTRLYTTGGDGLATLCGPQPAPSTRAKQVKLTVRMTDGRFAQQVLTLDDALAIVPLILSDRQ